MVKDLDWDWFEVVGWWVMIGVAAVLEPEMNIHLTLVGEAGVAAPQCCNRLTN